MPPPLAALLMRENATAPPIGPCWYWTAAVQVEPWYTLSGTPANEYEPLTVKPYIFGDV
ncbi:hypothetical protein AWB79_07618 [Caballeronia hypogeia]|uniref:Uncharacterized protein n=1 Tax=Caballeronia hypogeia TaxID=1777140 RepID=A0A158DW24_9BURK|nr:hypothetical protein AWB79_07618 [Caballeronia hypogeia]